MSHPLALVVRIGTRVVFLYSAQDVIAFCVREGYFDKPKADASDLSVAA